MVKHKSRYSCKNVICFDLGSDVIKANCRFTFYYNKTDITFTVLDGGNEIILANWSNDKQIICNVSNDIPVKIPSHPYVLVNRSVLCNCSIVVEINFLLESLAACQHSNSKLVMYFMVNKTFVIYLDQLDNLTDSLDVLIIIDKTTFQQTLPISLNASTFDSDLLTAPKMLKYFVHQHHHKKKEIFDLQERQTIIDSEMTNKKFLFEQFCNKCFSVHYCNNFIIGYSFSNVHIM